MVEYHEAKACKPYPHILTLGNDQSAFQAFVIIAGQALEQETLLQAIDVCFKAFFIFVPIVNMCGNSYRMWYMNSQEGSLKWLSLLKLEYSLASRANGS